MSNSKLKKLKSGIKTNTKVTLKISWNIVGDSNDKLLLTNTQVSKLCKAFTNGLSANTKLLKIQLQGKGQSGWPLGSLLGLVLKTGLALIGNILKPLAKSVLIPLRTTATASTDAGIHYKNVWVWQCNINNF